MDKNKLILPASIVIGCFILGAFFYVIQSEKQDSIERQQRLTIEANKEVEKGKTELEQKKYISEKKQDCLNIYKIEDGKWNNVDGWDYDDTKDICYIEYKQTPKKTESECDTSYPTKGESGYMNLMDNILCKDGLFRKIF